MYASLSVSHALRALLALGRHPIAIGTTALSLVACAACGALEMGGVHIGPPTAAMIAAQRRDRLRAQVLSDSCYALIQQGNAGNAISVCQRAVTLDPKSASAQTNLGLALIKSGNSAEGIPALYEAIRLAPRGEDAHYFLANALRDQGLLEAAIHQYEETLSINPNNAGAHHGLAVAHYRFGQDNECSTVLVFHSDVIAISEYLKAILAEPTYLPAFDRLIPLLVRYERMREAAQLQRQRTEVLRLAATQRVSPKLSAH